MDDLILKRNTWNSVLRGLIIIWTICLFPSVPETDPVYSLPFLYLFTLSRLVDVPQYTIPNPNYCLPRSISFSLSVPHLSLALSLSQRTRDQRWCGNYICRLLVCRRRLRKSLCSEKKLETAQHKSRAVIRISTLRMKCVYLFIYETPKFQGPALLLSKVMSCQAHVHQNPCWGVARRKL